MGIVTIIDITECRYQSNLIPLHLPTVLAHPRAGKRQQKPNGDVCCQCLNDSRPS